MDRIGGARASNVDGSVQKTSSQECPRSFSANFSGGGGGMSCRVDIV